MPDTYKEETKQLQTKRLPRKTLLTFYNKLGRVSKANPLPHDQASFLVLLLWQLDSYRDEHGELPKQKAIRDARDEINSRLLQNTALNNLFANGDSSYWLLLPHYLFSFVSNLENKQPHNKTQIVFELLNQYLSHFELSYIHEIDVEKEDIDAHLSVFHQVINMLLNLCTPHPFDIGIRGLPEAYRKRLSKRARRLIKRHQDKIRKYFHPIPSTEQEEKQDRPLSASWKKHVSEQFDHSDERNPHERAQESRRIKVISTVAGAHYEVPEASHEKRERFERLYQMLEHMDDTRIVDFQHSSVTATEFNDEEVFAVLRDVHTEDHIGFLRQRLEIVRRFKLVVTTDLSLANILAASHPNPEQHGLIAHHGEAFLTTQIWESIRQTFYCVSKDHERPAGRGRKIEFNVQRPPQHHGCPEDSGGFCVINASAARAIRALNAGKKIIWIDCDMHDGDGSREILIQFLQHNPQYTNNIRFINLYAHGEFPHKLITGEQTTQADGAIKNIPFFKVAQPGKRVTRDADYRAMYDAALTSLPADFDPRIVLFSFGTDACKKEHIGSGEGILKPETFGYMIHAALTRYDKAALIVNAEGGYNPDAVAKSWLQAIKAVYFSLNPSLAPVIPVGEKVSRRRTVSRSSSPSSSNSGKKRKRAATAATTGPGASSAPTSKEATPVAKRRRRAASSAAYVPPPLGTAYLLPFGKMCTIGPDRTSPNIYFTNTCHTINEEKLVFIIKLFTHNEEPQHALIANIPLTRWTRTGHTHRTSQEITMEIQHVCNKIFELLTANMLLNITTFCSNAINDPRNSAIKNNARNGIQQLIWKLFQNPGSQNATINLKGEITLVDGFVGILCSNLQIICSRGLAPVGTGPYQYKLPHGYVHKVIQKAVAVGSAWLAEPHAAAKDEINRDQYRPELYNIPPKAISECDLYSQQGLPRVPITETEPVVAVYTTPAQRHMMFTSAPASAPAANGYYSPYLG